MNKQEIFKENKFLVRMGSVIPVYKFMNGEIIDREVYDNKVWETSPLYNLEDYYIQTFEGDNYFIKSQTKTVNNLIEAHKFQRQQKQKLINKKKKEIEELEK